MLETELQERVIDLWDKGEFIGSCVDKTDGSALYKLDEDFFIIHYFDNYKIKEIQKVNLATAKECFPDALI